MLGRIRGLLGPHTSRSSNDWLLLPGGHRIEVAGILRHQKSLTRIAASRPDVETGEFPLIATLLRDTSDAQDPDAVTVAIVVPGESAALVVGSLTRELAPEAGRILKRLEEYGFHGAACHATLTEGGGRRARSQGALGVALDLASRARVEEYVAAVRKDPRAQPIEFEEDPESPVFKAERGWRVAGWVE
jgi:hypothetical protein